MTSGGHGAISCRVEEPTKQERLSAPAGNTETAGLNFVGLHGRPELHLGREELEAKLAALPAAPKDVGRVDMLVARGAEGERRLPHSAVLTVEGGMPFDRWAEQTKYGVDYQLATTRTDFARTIANGQALELHGDNLFLTLDLSSGNLPAGSRVRVGDAELEVTPQAHNGCKKWVQRFGLNPMQMNLDAEFRSLHLRGIYLRVAVSGRVTVGDAARVLHRAAA